MNAFNAHELASDPDGLLESCDVCNALIVNWDTLTNSFVLPDGKIACKKCKHELTFDKTADTVLPR